MVTVYVITYILLFTDIKWHIPRLRVHVIHVIY